MEKIKNILFVVNRTKPSALSIADRLSALAQKEGVNSEICADFPLKKEIFENKDLCCVIGGDGTVLSCVEGVAKFGIPVFGINLGKLGFLTTFTDSISDESFISLLSGDARILERKLLSAQIDNVRHLALNDFVIKNARAAGIMHFRVFVDDEFIADYSCDGLIFSTPTGSTAYNLSAGGPIMHPKAAAYVMTPICPHTLSNRSVVYHSAARVRIECLTSGAVLISDGTEIAKMECGAFLEITSPPDTLKFMRARGHSHFSILRSKLGWAKDPRQSAE